MERAAVFAILRQRGSAQEIGKVHCDRAVAEYDAAASDQLVSTKTRSQSRPNPATGAGSSQEEVSGRVLVFLIPKSITPWRDRYRLREQTTNSIAVGNKIHQRNGDNSFAYSRLRFIPDGGKENLLIRKSIREKIYRYISPGNTANIRFPPGRDGKSTAKGIKFTERFYFRFFFLLHSGIRKFAICVAEFSSLIHRVQRNFARLNPSTQQGFPREGKRNDYWGYAVQYARPFRPSSNPLFLRRFF